MESQTYAGKNGEQLAAILQEVIENVNLYLDFTNLIYREELICP